MLRYDDDSVLTGSSDGLIRVLSIQPNKMLGVLGEHSGGWASGGWAGGRVMAVAMAMAVLDAALCSQALTIFPSAPASDYPIERLSLSADRAFLASASHDNSVKVWDLAQLATSSDDDEDGVSDAEEDGDDEEEEVEEAAAAGASGKAQSKEAAAAAKGGRQRGAAAAAAGMKPPSGGSGGGASAPAAAAAGDSSGDDNDEEGGGGGGGAEDSDSDSDGGRRGKAQEKKRVKGQHRIPTKRQALGGNFFSDLL